MRSISVNSKSKKILFFTMVQHPIHGWMRVGNAYLRRNIAREWIPIVKGTWRICKVKVSQCTVTYIDGELSSRSRRILSEKYNLDS